MKRSDRRTVRKAKRDRHLLEVAVGSVLCISGAFLLWVSFLPVPDITAFTERKVAQSTKIYDRTGEVLLYDTNPDVRRRLVPLSEIAEDAKHAAIAIEDEDFYKHIGIHPVAFARAVLVNLSTGSFSQGGSTITQQVVKNSLLTMEKSVDRKIKEWVLAVKLEQVYTKDQILESYFNEIPYGGTIYGIEEASRRFFGKSAKDLSLPESAYLAAIPQRPTYYSPYGRNKAGLDARKDRVLDAMAEQGYITTAERDEAKRADVAFLPDADGSIRAPHFVFYVREYLEETYGPDALVSEGLKVVTSLDYELQSVAEEIVRRNALANEQNFNAENAALVALDPRTGEILSMVGSRDYFDESIDGKVNIALSLRQPGSTFKPFVYAKAIEKGYTRDTVLFDYPTQFSTACPPSSLSDEDPCYAPGSYDGQFRGPVTFMSALAQSLNVPAVEALYLAGIKDSIELARRVGISTFTDASRYGLSLVLGGGEVKLLELVSAYGVFAADGVRSAPVSILEVTGRDGTVLEKAEFSSSQALSSEVARDISYMLSDDAARIPAFGAGSALSVPGYDVAAKTGTTNDYRDAWIVGYTPNLVAGAWAGNNDNTPMEKKVAGFIVAPLWNEFMQAALAKRPREFFSEPAPVDQSLPGMLRGVWGEGGMHSILHYVPKNDPRSPGSSVNDPQYAYWEAALRRAGF